MGEWWPGQERFEFRDMRWASGGANCWKRAVQCDTATNLLGGV